MPCSAGDLVKQPAQARLGAARRQVPRRHGGQLRSGVAALTLSTLVDVHEAQTVGLEDVDAIAGRIPRIEQRPDDVVAQRRRAQATQQRRVTGSGGAALVDVCAAHRSPRGTVNVHHRGPERKGPRQTRHRAQRAAAAARRGPSALLARRQRGAVVRPPDVAVRLLAVDEQVAREQRPGPPRGRVGSAPGPLDPARVR